MPPGDFLQKARKEGYDGVEINMPDNSLYVEEFLSSIHNIKTEGNPAFVFIAQQVLTLQKESADVYRKKMEKRLTELALMRPLFINSHTGKDYYTFEENCRIIEIAENIAAKTGVPVYHEIHRGRFTFSSSIAFTLSAIVSRYKIMWRYFSLVCGFRIYVTGPGRGFV